MNAPMTLHYAPDNASLCVRLALEECGFAYQTTLVDRANQAQRSAAYLALNPNGLIPVLVTPQGAIFETAAILLWLSEQPQGRALMPHGVARQEALSWLFWLSNSLHPALRMVFYPDQHIEAGGSAALRRRTCARLSEMLDRLEAVAVKRPVWLRAEQATALSCYLCPMLRWMAIYPADATDWFDLARWPGLNTLATGIEKRQASLRAAAAEGLGPTPFSQPSLPNPPEGSAI